MKNFWIIDWNPKEVKVSWRYPTFWRDETFDAEANYYERYIISYDWAKRKDKPGIVVIGIAKKPVTKDDVKNLKAIASADVLMSAYIEAWDYFEHVDYCYDIHKLLTKQGKKVDIVIDYGWAGVAVEEIFQRMNKKGVTVDSIMAVWGLNAERDWGIVGSTGASSSFEYLPILSTAVKFKSDCSKRLNIPLTNMCVIGALIFVFHCWLFLINSSSLSFVRI